MPALLSPGQLHVVETGPADAPPVLVLHGWGSSAQLMQPIADALSDAYHVFNLDLPGHGRSPLPPAPWGVPEYADLVRRFLDARGLDRVAVIGHSNGGRIALYMASDPATVNRFTGLVLVSPSGIKPVRSWTYYVKTYTARLLKTPLTWLPEPVRGHTLDWLRHSLVWKLLGSSDYRTLQGVMRETFVKTVNCYVDDRLGCIQAPTLLFRGDRDPAISEHQMHVLERGIPDAGLITLKQAGHFGHLDDPVTFNAATRYFLDHHSP